MAAGRPTKYKPEYCDVVRDIMGHGFSKTAVAGHLKISRQTLLNWAERHPEFMDAVKEGEARRVQFLETGLLDGSANVTSRIFALKNACPEEWRDQHDYAHTSPDGSMSQPDPVALSRAIFEVLRAGAGGNGPTGDE